MKKLFWKALSLLAIVLLVGCDEGVNDGGGSVRLSENGAVFGADGGTKSVVVTTTPKGLQWSVTATAQPEWLEFMTKDSLVVVSAKPNYTTELRYAMLQVASTSGEFDTIELPVSQEAGEAISFVTSAPESYTFDSRGGSCTFTVEANHKWSAQSDAEWLSVECSDSRVTISVEEHTGETERNANVDILLDYGGQTEKKSINVTQHTLAQNRYLNLVGKWNISASQWLYSPNGSLNTYPNPNDANASWGEKYRTFDIEEGVYGKTLVMRNFLYPGTALEVRYDAESGGFIIPFGWTVLSYDVFLYITLISGKKPSYASLEVAAICTDGGSALIIDMPKLSGYDYIGFGLWTYNDNGGKSALGSSSYPTLFPMGSITLYKQQE